ncbi:inositol 1,4,5-trisphosphate receptor-interacting protein-like 1 [Phoenicopterus ruber ruber]
MAVIVFLALAVLAIVQDPLQPGEELHAGMHRLVQHLVQQLSWNVTQLLQDTEQSQEKNGVAGKVLLLAPFQQWCFWAFALAAGALLLLLLLWLCRRTRKRSHQLESSCLQDSSRHQDKEEEEEEEEGEEDEDDDDDDDEDSDDTWDLGRCVADCIQWPVPYMADTCKLVEELVDELLCTCQSLPGNIFKPRLQPAIGVGCVYAGWRAWADNVLYRLLVPLQPPPGHAFCLEPGTAEDVLTSDSCLRVQLRCMCMREQLLEDILCFLHHSRHELKRQGPSLLNTLCTNSYLNIEKTACWFQMLVKDAWKLMPLSHRCQLTVLPTTRSCKLRITNGEETLSIEMIFGVQLEDSDSFLSLE